MLSAIFGKQRYLFKCGAYQKYDEHETELLGKINFFQLYRFCVLRTVLKRGLKANLMGVPIT